MLANGALVYQYQGGSIVMKAAWHWGSESSVVNDPLGEPDRTALYVGLLSTWGSVDGELMFSPFSVKGPLTGEY